MTAEPLHRTDNDHVIEQGYAAYTEADHAIWQDLFMRQSNLLPGRACAEFMEGL